jgi:hypothetical protein
MYLVNRASVAASASGKEPPRRLEPHELAELIRSNKVRREELTQTLTLTPIPTPTLTLTLTLTFTLTLTLTLTLTRCAATR